MSLEDSLLLSLLYQGTASFERHRRSVQARVPLREANRVKAARRQRAQASRAAFGMCVLSGTREERTSSGFGVSGCEGRSMDWETGLSRAGWHLGQHGQVLVQMRREQTGQIKDLAFQKPDGVHLDVVLEALFWWSSPGPLCRGGMGSTAQREAGFAVREGEGGEGGPRAAPRGVGVVWRWLCDPLRPKGLSMAFSVLPLTSGPGSEASPIRLLRKRRVHDAPPCFSQRAWSGVVTVHLCQNPGIKNMMDFDKIFVFRISP